MGSLAQLPSSDAKNMPGVSIHKEHIHVAMYYVAGLSQFQYVKTNAIQATSITNEGRTTT